MNNFNSIICLPHSRRRFSDRVDNDATLIRVLSINKSQLKIIFDLIDNSSVTFGGFHES